MAYDEKFAARIRDLLAERDEVTEKRMFGGLAFSVDGNMAVCASSSGGLMVRVPAEDLEDCLARPHAGPMEMSGRPVRGWVLVAIDGVRTKRELQAWVNRGLAYASSLPPK